jgi:hypothetical protein
MPTLTAVSNLVLHWPTIDREILWRQAHAQRRALEVLAFEQYDSGGLPVPIGRKRLDELLTVTAGEAEAMLHAMRQLALRGVVKELRAFGNQPSAWTFSADLRRWRGLPWVNSAAYTESLFLSCRCSTPRAFAQQFPDQGVHLLNSSSKIVAFRSSGRVPSGILQSELLSNRERCRTNAWRSGAGPESHDELLSNREGRDDALLSFSSSKEELSRGPESNYESHRLYKAAIGACNTPGFTGKFFPNSAPARAIARCVDRWNEDQVDQAVIWLNEGRARGQKVGPDSIVAALESFPRNQTWPPGGEAIAG